VLAAPLIIVGFFMMKCVKNIDWEDVTEAIPAFLTMIVMPLTLSITEGIAAGFISYCLLKLATGKGRRVHWLIYFFSLLFIVRFIVS
jgi:AGZA family xanthine/uracil permease-like MFS transporter